MLKWPDVIAFATRGNPSPPRRVEKSEQEWRAQLTPEEFRVTRQAGTERAFSHASCELFAPGRYRCACCDTLLFDAKQSLRLPALAADEARPKLAALVACWAQGMKRPLPFFPSTAWEWLKAIEKDPEKSEAADKAALTRFNGGYMAKGEGEDAYVARCFPELDEAVLAQLQALAREHLTPLLKSLEELQ